MIYLDHAATSPLRSEAREAMRPWLERRFGNPASLHRAGREAREAVEAAREIVARCLGARPEGIVFTSGGTEADNLALRGLQHRGRVLVSAVEHAAVLEPAAALERQGIPVTRLGVDADGRVADEDLPQATVFLSVMLVNNEVGTIQPVAALAKRARARGALVHTDAVQAAGKIPVDVGSLDVDLLSLSAHKVGGPQGVGALYVRPGVPLSPLQLGGGQEAGLRSGTLNVAGIVGFAAALDAACGDLAASAVRVAALRDRLQAGLLALGGIRVNAGRAERTPYLLSVCVEGLDGEAALMRLDEAGVCASSGSACSSEDFEPSHVLTAMGLSRALTKGALRFSLGPTTATEDVDAALRATQEVIGSLRALSA